MAEDQDLESRGAAYLQFRQHFARALCVAAMAEPDDTAGHARREAELGRAKAMLDGLTEEARQLQRSKELYTMIAEAGKPPSTNGVILKP